MTGRFNAKQIDIKTLSVSHQGNPMAIANYQTLMLPVLKSSSLGEVRIRDVVEKLKGEFELTPEEASELMPSGNQTISNRVHWAKTYLAKAG